MQVHLFPEVPAPLAGIDELPGEPEAVADVVGATAPFPVPDTGRPPRLVRVVARAGLYAALAAGPRYAVRHRCARYRVDERRLSAAWKLSKKKKRQARLFTLPKFHNDNNNNDDDIW